nr:MAG TPA: hypothetical protein [Caudoviricetes sp.]
MSRVDDIVAAYVRLRDQKAELKAQQAEVMKPYDEALAKLEAEALQILSDTGVESMKTSAGTVYKSVATSATVQDKSAFMDYIKEHQAFDLLDVRANKTAVQDFVTENQDTPPGVVIRREMKVGFRRA